MKLAKSLLLGTAAGLAAFSGAQAADLPSKKAAPVEYVRICSAHGAGFFFIPGSNICIKFSGRVRAEYGYLEPRWAVSGTGRAVSSLGYRARARLDVDTRTTTEFGTLRTFFRFEATSNRGANYGFNGNPGVFDSNKAFIQFAGFTAGKTTSFFDFYANDVNWGRLAGSDSYGNDPIVLAYTASFGGGFSATLSLEDNNAKRTALVTTGGIVAGGAYGGLRAPDVVAALRVDQAWGSAQLSGAVHQIFTNNILFNRGIDTEYGYAIQAGVKINLPMIAAGDRLWLQAAYAEGNASALGAGAPSIGPLGIVNTDAVAVATGPTTATLKKQKGYALVAAFTHFWTPAIRSNIFGSYLRVDYSNIVPVATARDYTEWRVGTNLIWSPVRGLDLGVEVIYANLDPKGRILVVPATGVTRGSDHIWEARLRIQRDF